VPFDICDKLVNGICSILFLNTENVNADQALIVKFIDRFMSGRNSE
jgi:hypothetical protein